MLEIFMSEEEKRRYKWCPKCGAKCLINKPFIRCFDCWIPFVSYDEYKNRDKTKVMEEYKKAQIERKETNKQRDAQRRSANRPTCPTCGSTNVEKISTAAKVGGAAMFGLLSKTARSQFKCKNCGYKW